MPLYQVVVLALVQAFTEFLPISSTAHLALSRWLLGWTGDGSMSDLTFDIALHAGTLLATVVYFFRDWLQIGSQALGIDYRPDPEIARNSRLLWMLAAATLPVAVIGLLFEKYAETVFRGPLVIAVMLIGVGIIMWIADQRQDLKKGIDRVTWADSLVIGFAQALAIIPGTSRSGITMTASLFRGLKRDTAARFSFLLSTPALFGAAIMAFRDIWKAGGIPPELMTSFLAGVVVSAVTGWLVIAWLLRYLRTRTLRFFIYYRVIFGIIVIALVLFRRAG
ncbi:MAG TPA: undecaprenyl-diphosphate phosphatase [Bryobacteraceae bacterium]|nr:undecaprenyl-diphosphate phosphatase [Bryobacteraceae bacterium]